MAVDATEMGIVGDPVGDERAVADAVLRFRSVIAKGYQDPSVEIDDELRSVSIDPILSAVVEFFPRERERGRFTLPNPSTQSWFRVMSDNTAVENDTATVEVCFLDSHMTMEHAGDEDVLVDDTIAMFGLVFGLVRVEGSWFVSTQGINEELATRCGPG